MSWIHRIRQASGIDSAIRELQSMQQRNMADKGCDDVDEIRQGRVDYDSLALSETGGEFDGDQVDDSSSEALAEAHDTASEAIGNFKIGESSADVKIWLRFWESLEDYSGNGNDAVIVAGSEKYGSGKARHAFDFDAATQLKITNPNLSTTEITVSFWVYHTTHVNWHDMVVRKGWSGVGAWNVFSNSLGIVTFGIRRADNSQAGVQGSAIPLNTWTMITAGYKSSTGAFSIWVNKTKSTGTEAGLALDNTTDITISEVLANKNYRIEGLRIWPRLLADSEVDNLHDTVVLGGGSIYDAPLAIAMGSVGA